MTHVELELAALAVAEIGEGKKRKKGKGRAWTGRKVSDPRTETRGNTGAAVVPRRGGRAVPKLQA